MRWSFPTTAGSLAGQHDRRRVVGTVLHTRLCELFGIKYPVLNAPMGGGDAPLGSPWRSRRPAV